MTREQFKVGDRVYDRRDKATGTLIEMKRHTNGSPKWLVEFAATKTQGAGRYWTWEADLRLLPVAETATK